MAETANQASDSVHEQSEQPYPEKEAVEANSGDPVGGTAKTTPPESVSPEGLPEGVTVDPAEQRQPRAEYEVIASKREEPQSEYMAEHYKQIGIDASYVGKNVQGKDQVSRPKFSAASAERNNKIASSKTGVYAVIGIGLGLLVGLAAAVLLLHPGSVGGPNDMGAVNSIEYGLRGHLTTEWKDDRLSYHLTLESATAAQHASFVADVNRSPQPLSVTIQEKDPFGEVLCSDTILVKYDPRNAPMTEPASPQPKSAKAAEEIATRNEIAQGLKLALLEGQELDREHGKNLFQSDIGADGQLKSISAQGILRCNSKQVDRFASWGFISNFPALAKPALSENPTPDPKANVNTAAAEEEARRNAEVERAAAAAKTKKKPALPPLPPIFVEGDDQIVWIDTSGAVAETSGGKALILDKGDTLAMALKGRDLPIAIHYRCNETVGCTFSTVGLGIHHARLRQ